MRYKALVVLWCTRHSVTSKRATTSVVFFKVAGFNLAMCDFLFTLEHAKSSLVYMSPCVIFLFLP